MRALVSVLSTSTISLSVSTVYAILPAVNIRELALVCSSRRRLSRHTVDTSGSPAIEEPVARSTLRCRWHPGRVHCSWVNYDQPHNRYLRASPLNYMNPILNRFLGDNSPGIMPKKPAIYQWD